MHTSKIPRPFSLSQPPRTLHHPSPQANHLSQLTITSSAEPFLDLPESWEFLAGTRLALALEGVARDCASDAYILVSQPGVSADDFSSKTAAPHLRRRLGFGSAPDPDVTFKSVIPEVVGLADSSLLRKRLQTSCNAKLSYLDYSSGDLALPEQGQTPSVLVIDLPALPSTNVPKARAAELAKHDSFLDSVIERLSSASYTLVVTTTPIPEASSTSVIEKARQYAASLLDTHKDHVYDTDAETQDFPVSALHTDLKRQLHNKRQDSSNDTEYNNRALFEKYSFLNAGMFMGIMTVLILGSILSVGVSAIANLEVSYGSFTKEMGQAAKKQ